MLAVWTVLGQNQIKALYKDEAGSDGSHYNFL